MPLLFFFFYRLTPRIFFTAIYSYCGTAEIARENGVIYIVNTYLLNLLI